MNGIGADIVGIADFEPPNVSFEYFPPKSPKQGENFWRAVKRLEILQPNFVSLTSGASGSDKSWTETAVQRIVSETELDVAAHMTCAGSSAAALTSLAERYWQLGVRKIVALRGDQPSENGELPPSDTFEYAVELVAAIRKIANFDISVACYPEVHPEAISPEADMDNLKRKIDAGADRAISQFFFDADAYLKFMDKTQAAGIDIPIVPGILPVLNFDTVVRFAKACNAKVPAWLHELYQGLDADPATRRMVSTHVAVAQCRQLQRAGINEFHFYTLNNADVVYSVCHLLGLRADRAPLNQATSVSSDTVNPTVIGTVAPQ